MVARQAKKKLVDSTGQIRDHVTKACSGWASQFVQQVLDVENEEHAARIITFVLYFSFLSFCYILCVLTILLFV
jgi:hypothetical protein